jgi:hypothetical protein
MREMKSKSFPRATSTIVLIALLAVVGHLVAKDKKKKTSVCSNSHPEQLCSIVNTCGSADSPCQLNVKRGRDGVSATIVPNIPGFPKNSNMICVRVGTTVNWQSTHRNTGFMVDFGAASPFGSPEMISGGADRPVTVATKNVGCFRYSVSACTPGSVYGMCGNSDFELIVTSGGN